MKRFAWVLALMHLAGSARADGVKLDEDQRTKVKAALAKAKLAATKQVRMAMSKARGERKAELKKQLEGVCRSSGRE